MLKIRHIKIKSNFNLSFFTFLLSFKEYYYISLPVDFIISQNTTFNLYTD